jgi:hypothetical protein
MYPVQESKAPGVYRWLRLSASSARCCRAIDNSGRIIYTGKGIGYEGSGINTVPTVNEGGEETMILFLSFPRLSPEIARITSVLTQRGFTVFTNFDRLTDEEAEERTDQRLDRIRCSDAFIFFAGSGASSVRQIEFGYALGREIPVSFVGPALNSLHRYGDVFSDTDDFLASWFPFDDHYRRTVEEWHTHRERTPAVA